MCGLVICVMALILTVIVLCIIFGKNPFYNKMLGLALCMLLPLAYNLVFLMSASSDYFVHTLMRYALVFVFVFLLILLEKSDGLLVAAQKDNLNIFISSVSIIIISVLAVGYIYTNNAAYMRMTLVQKQAESYFTVLVSEIKGTEGYRDEMPVVYVGERQIEDDSLGILSSDIGNMTGFSYSLPGILNNYAWKQEVYFYTGFQPNEASQDFWKVHKEQVAGMTCYPDDGGIRIIDGTVVVKFAEVE